MLDLLGVSEENILREEWGLRLGLRKELRELLERLYVSFGIEGKQAALWTPADPTLNGRRIFSPRRRSEEHTSELQSRPLLVCRLLLEKKKTQVGADSHSADAFDKARHGLELGRPRRSSAVGRPPCFPPTPLLLPSSTDLPPSFHVTSL